MGLLEPETVRAGDVIGHYGRWKAPKEDKAAIKHRAEHVHHDFFGVGSSHVRDLKEFGVGHMMYFTFLWWMAALFCTLALLVGAPTMAISLAGKYYESGQLELTTLGNFGRVSVAHNYDGHTSITSTATGAELERAVAVTFMGDAAVGTATWPFDKRKAVVAASVIDCVGACVYFVVTLGLILLARRRAEDADTHTVTIHDYSVYVHKLPQDATSNELVDFFGQWGEVESVELVRAYGNMLKLVLTRGRLLQQLKSAIAALQKAADSHTDVPVVLEKACHVVKKKVAKVDKDIKAEQAVGDTARVVGAFVTFRNEHSKLACLKATPHSYIKQWWQLKPEHKFRGRQPLDIREAPEPSDVQYENMEHGAWDRFGRTLLTLVCSYTALGLGFFLISLTTASRIQVAQVAGVNADDCNSCRLSVDGGFGLSAADKDLYAACDRAGRTPAGLECSSIERQCYRCFCYTSVTSGRLSDSSYCSNAIGLLALQYSSQVGVVLAILGINMLLSLTSRRLTLFEKHHTRSSEARALAHRLFLAQFLNSAVSTIIANAHLPFLDSLFNGTALAGIFFQGIYTDLTPNWYKVVGRSLLISQFVAATLRVVYLMMRWGASWWARHRRASCLTQEELENSLRGPEFLLDHRYGEHLSVIFVSMLLCGAMPIALFSAAFWFVTSYWCDKLELLRLSRRPVTYGNTLSDHVMNLLPYAAVLHVAFALWAYSLCDVPQSPLVTGTLAFLVRAAFNATEAGWKAVSGFGGAVLAERLLSEDAAHLLMVLMLMVGVLFLKLTLTRWIQAGHWVLNMLGLVADNEDTQHTGAPEFPVAVRTQLLVGEASYAIQDQPAYATAFTKMEDADEDVCVKVVLKGPSIKHRRATAELAAAQQQQQQFVLAQQQQQQQQQFALAQQQQQQQQQFGSPRSQGILSEAAYPQFPPLTASTGAVQGTPGSAVYPGVVPLQGLAPDNSQLPYAGSSIDAQQQQQLQAGSWPSTNGSGGSRHSSRAASRSSSGGYSSGSRAAGGEAGAAEGLPLQLPQGSGDGGFVYGGWPRMPDSARLQQQLQGGGGGGYDAGYGMPAASTAPSLSAAWGDPGSQAAVQAEQQQLSAAQRFRQARTNQVVPIPEEYLGGPAKIG